MNIQRTIKTVLIGSVLCANSVLFADTPKVSVSVNIGKTLSSLDDSSFSDVSTKGKEVVGAAIEYAFNEHLALELQVARGTVEVSAPNLSVETQIDSTALYLVQRSVGQTYIKTKLGILKEDVSGGSFDESGTGLSYGLGVGYSFSEQFSIEAEYIKVEQDVAWFLVSGKYSFGL